MEYLKLFMCSFGDDKNQKFRRKESGLNKNNIGLVYTFEEEIKNRYKISNYWSKLYFS